MGKACLRSVVLLTFVILAAPRYAIVAQDSSSSKYFPALSPDGKHISYIVEGSDNSTLYVMHADDTGSTSFATLENYAPDEAPVWSPDSQHLAFVDYKDDKHQINFIDVNGSNARTLSPDIIDSSEPAWSPDSTHIAFTASQDSHHNINVIAVDGSHLTQLTKDSGNNTDPNWSPDGSKFAFTSDHDGNTQIYIMDADGSNLHRLTKDNDQNSQPAWSPDGKRIAFVSGNNQDSKWHLRVVNAQNGHVDVPQIDGSISAFRPVWSPDGMWIAAPITYGMSGHIWLVDTRTYSALDLFAVGSTLFSHFSEAQNESPSWSRDSEQIVFASSTSGLSEVYSMARDGSHITQLTGATASP